jgi:N-acetylglutamate synthase-like GNAT family acetyltransferase
VAVDAEGEIIGVGQVKPHKDGTFELASIAVLPEWRGRGVARQIIEQLLEKHPGRLYLFCRAQMQPLYRKFGFEAIEFQDMPPYCQKIKRLAAAFDRRASPEDKLSVMRRN